MRSSTVASRLSDDSAAEQLAIIAAAASIAAALAVPLLFRTASIAASAARLRLAFSASHLDCPCCAPRLAETPFSGRDPQEGDDDDDRGNRTDWDRSGPGWAHVAPTQARCGAAPVAG